MLIPSIDLMGGKIVQLVQGEAKALESDDFDGWAARFASYPLVQIIDLDAAMGSGDNRELVAQFAGRLPCQVGGGIRSLSGAEAVLAMGARRVICGSALFREGEINLGFAQQLAATIGSERLVFALDSKNGRVAIRGWRELTSTTPAEMMQTLEPWCDAFLYTHVDTEGLMQGIPLETVCQLRSLTQKQLIVAGGIRNVEEVEQLDSMKIDAVVGMAIYTGRLKV